jgi:hypothetical protein
MECGFYEKGGNIHRGITCCISWVLSSMKPETLVKLWKKTDPYLQDNNLQGSHNEEIIKFKILNIIFAM